MVRRASYGAIRTDFTGRQLGDWTVLGPGGRNKFDQRMWKCRCKCGTLREVHGSKLASLAKHGFIPTSWRGKSARSLGRCRECSRIAAAQSRCRGPAQLAYTRMLAGAIARNLDVAITKDDLLPLIEKQEYKCALSNIPLKLANKRSEDLDSNASLDRKDSSKGYLLDNIQWVDKRINLMKMDLPEDEFISLCCAVADHIRGDQYLRLAA